MTEPNLRTPLYDQHLALGARIVPFGGWDMPVQYSGIINEVKAVRTATGIFDVSHMGRLYISGPKAAEFLDWVLTGSASTLRIGRARYCMICNERGGVIDDTVFYRLAEDQFLLVPNAGNRGEVVSWFQGWLDRKFAGQCAIDDQTSAKSLIAFQGPGVPAIMDRLCDNEPSSLRFFAWRHGNFKGHPVMVARTGYTGEDGFEIVVDNQNVGLVWETLLEQGATPCGLGARDVLRLEAALPLHGHELDPDTSPLEAGLERFVRLDAQYVSSAALQKQHNEGVARSLVGLTMPGRSAPRAGYPILAEGQQVGTITSGTYSPTLDTSIALGYVFSRYATPGRTLEVDIRGRIARVKIVDLPFYTRDKKP